MHLSSLGMERRASRSDCSQNRAAEFRDHGTKAWFCLSRRRAGWGAPKPEPSSLAGF